MMVTLDNGENVLILEQQNILPQIKDYIDGELYDLLNEQFVTVHEDLERLEKLEEESVDKEVEYGCLSDKYNDLEDKYDDLYDEKKELDELKDKILDEINGLADELDEDNFKEIANKLKEIYWNN